VAPAAPSPEEAAAKEKVLMDALRVEEFLEASRSQLTYHGLFELMRVVQPSSLCAFFRNCHFGVLHNHEGELYILLTDAGYGDVRSAVWEKLCEVDGDNVIVDASFRVARAEEPAPVSAAPPPVVGTVVGTVLPPGQQQQQPVQGVVAGTVVPPTVDPWAAQPTAQQPAAVVEEQRPQADTDGDLAMALQMQEEETMAAQREEQARERQHVAAREAMEAASALGRADKEMPPGTRVRVDGRGDGTVEGFEGHWIGANEHKIRFDGTREAVDVKLRDLDWQVLGPAGDGRGY